ncbi:hypothetical protein ASD54_12245 [Rhizobium sp. Root149]|nr:hypothetical protein ASD54_12245 [Rhizobium sp. Root149]
MAGVPAAPVMAPAANPVASIASPSQSQRVDLSLIPRAPSSSEIIAAAQRNYKEPGNWASAFAQGWTNAQAVSSAADREREDAIAKTTYEQNQALKKQAEADRLKARQVEYIRARSPEMADAVDAGIMDAGTAFTEWKKAQKGGKKNFVTLPNGDYGFADEENGTIKIVGSAAKPQAANSEIGKLAEDYNSGRIDQQQYEAGLARLAPKGMTVKSDGAGGFTLTQGPVGAGADLNVEQGKNTGFLLRAQDADKIISGLENESTSLFNKAAQAVPGGLGNYVLSDDAQKVDQAKRDFINAVLRQESGAVISPEEFANADKQYFPQPGDSAAVIEQKRNNRRNAVEGFRIRSGPGATAVDQVRPQGGAQPQQAPQSQMQAPVQSPALDKARAAIAAGADPEKVKQRLRENGIEPTGL